MLTEDVSIGRETDNQIFINEPAVSRNHCKIRVIDEVCQLSDLGSHNGTFVNGVPVREQLLEDGDQVRVGNSLFLFLQHEGDASLSSSRVELKDEDLTSHSTVQIRHKDAFYLDSEKVLSLLPPTARIARDLAVLLKFSTLLNSLRDTEAIERQLLEAIFQVVPAESGAILRSSEEAKEFVSMFGQNRNSGDDAIVQVSSTITRQVLQEGCATLSVNISESDELKSAESLISSRTQSVLCVPLTVLDKTLGVIYLSSSNLTVRFDEDHLQLVTAIASLAAIALQNAKHIERLQDENEYLRTDIQIESSMVGQSQRMSEVHQFIAKVAPTDSTVLIYGESGTGKELAARAIHQNSSRAERPFVAINCATLTETLLESDLFGHEKGAFTGAIVQKKGKLEIADGGTVFLDEIGELATPLQAKLLRVLQEREFERLGGTRSIKVDIRIIAATNRDLEALVRAGGFRRDLYFRLNVVSLQMPSLRERREDIPLLAQYFALKYGNKCKREVRGLSTKARLYLTNYDWPGNVRELENTIERAIVLGSSDFILPDDLPETVLEAKMPSGLSPAKYQDALTELKKQLILKAFEQTEGNHNEAAKILGMHPNNLHRMIKNMDLKSILTR